MPRPTSSSTVKAIAQRRARRVVAQEPLGRGDDDRDARLVVRAEQRRPVARDEVVADPLGEPRHAPSGSSTWPRVAGEPDRRRRPSRGGRSARRPCPSAPGDVSTCAIRPTVGAPATVPGTRREHVAVLGQLDVVEPERAQLLDEQAREVELLLGRRVRRSTSGRTACRSRRSAGSARARPRPAPRRAGSRSASQPSDREAPEQLDGRLQPVAEGRRGDVLVRRVELRARPARTPSRSSARPARPSAATSGIEPPERMSSGRTPSTCSNASGASRTAGDAGST